MKSSLYSQSMRARGLLVVLLIGCSAWAVDDPASPDLVGEFDSRAKPFEAAVSEVAGSSTKVATANAAYERFLTSELERAFQAARSKLAPEAQGPFHDAHKRWLAFRDAEFAFIDAQCTTARVGSSAGLARGQSRAALLRDRVRQLLLVAQSS